MLQFLPAPCLPSGSACRNGFAGSIAWLQKVQSPEQEWCRCLTSVVWSRLAVAPQREVALQTDRAAATFRGESGVLVAHPGFREGNASRAHRGKVILYYI